MKTTYRGSPDEDKDSVLIEDILRGEPVFVLRARDAQTRQVIEQYADVVQPLFSPERWAQLQHDIDAWRTWQHANSGLVRDPD